MAEPNELEAWREVHSTLLKTCELAQESVDAQRMQYRYWLEEVVANVTPQGTLVSTSAWTRPKKPRKRKSMAAGNSVASSSVKKKKQQRQQQQQQKTEQDDNEPEDDDDEEEDEDDDSFKPTASKKIRISLNPSQGSKLPKKKHASNKQPLKKRTLPVVQARPEEDVEDDQDSTTEDEDDDEQEDGGDNDNGDDDQEEQADDEEMAPSPSLYASSRSAQPYVTGPTAQQVPPLPPTGLYGHFSSSLNPGQQHELLAAAARLQQQDPSYAGGGAHAFPNLAQELLAQQQHQQQHQLNMHPQTPLQMMQAAMAFATSNNNNNQHQPAAEARYPPQATSYLNSMVYNHSHQQQQQHPSAGNLMNANHLHRGSVAHSATTYENIQDVVDDEEEEDEEDDPF